MAAARAMSTWRCSRPFDFHDGADLDAATDLQRRTALGDRQRGVHVVGDDHGVAGEPSGSTGDLADGSGVDDSQAEVRQAGAHAAEPGLPCGNALGGTRHEAEWHTVGEDVLAHGPGPVLSPGCPYFGPPLTG